MLRGVPLQILLQILDVSQTTFLGQLDNAEHFLFYERPKKKQYKKKLLAKNDISEPCLGWRHGLIINLSAVNHTGFNRASTGLHYDGVQFQ